MLGVNLCMIIELENQLSKIDSFKNTLNEMGASL